MSVLLPKYDPLDPAVVENPYPTYERLRHEGPLCRGGLGQLVVTRYADVARLLRAPELSHQFPDEYYRFAVGDGPTAEFFQRILLNRVPLDHARLRGLMSSAFSSSFFRAIGDRIVRLVDDLLTPALDRGQFDVVRDLAFPLPVLFICELLGIPSAEQDDVCRRTTALWRAFTTQIDSRDRAAANDAVIWLRDYFGNLRRARRRQPGDDLLSRLSTTVGQDDDEAIDNIVFLFISGFETIMSLIANGCAALLAHPGEFARLRANCELIPSGVEEFLRFDAPVQSVARLVRDSVEVGDRTIRPGRVLLLLLGSANRDERQFTAPDLLDVGRQSNMHVSFGGGSHFCLGSALGRLEATVAFSRLIGRFAKFDAAGPLVRRQVPGIRTFASVPILVRPA